MAKLFKQATWLQGKNTEGYGPKPIPNTLDMMISEVIDCWRLLDEQERIQEAEAISDDQRAALLAYSERMASNAVRLKSRLDLVRGIIALAIDGWRFEWRENVMLVSLHFNSANKIGVSPQDLFLEASNCLSEQVKDALLAFLRRKPEDQKIEAMGFRESSDSDGFRYERVW